MNHQITGPGRRGTRGIALSGFLENNQILKKLNAPTFNAKKKLKVMKIY
jgi:hypothetical protein